MFYTYVLKSENFEKFYTGYTENLDKRLMEHNEGLNYYSKRYIPWNIIYFETFKLKEEAIRREKYFKIAAATKWLKKNIGNSKV